MVEKSWNCQQAVSVTILISKHFYLMTKKVDLYKRYIKGCDIPYPGQAAHLGLPLIVTLYHQRDFLLIWR